MYNNMITNNVAGLAGGGISIENSLSVSIRNNTIANNDSTATTALAGSGDPNFTTPQPAGIVSRAHSGDVGLLMTEVTDPGLATDWLTFSDPTLIANIVYQNRSFYWENTPVHTGLVPADCTPANIATCVFDDLAVLGAIGQLLDPTLSLLTDTTGYDGSNITGNPAFVNPYFNGSRDNLSPPQTAAAFDEGGNFIQVVFGPLTLDGFDYHITGASAALDGGGVPGTLRLAVDFDNQPRANPTEIGADELADEL